MSKKRNVEHRDANNIPYIILLLFYYCSNVGDYRECREKLLLGRHVRLLISKREQCADGAISING